MGNIQIKQYTVRNLPEALDQKLRQRAKETGKSLNEVVIDTLKKGAGLADKPIIHHNLDKYIGTWVGDPEFDKAMEDFEQIDEACWK